MKPKRQVLHQLLSNTTPRQQINVKKAMCSPSEVVQLPSEIPTCAISSYSTKDDKLGAATTFTKHKVKSNAVLMKPVNNHCHLLSLLFVVCCRTCSSCTFEQQDGTLREKFYHNHCKESKPVERPSPLVLHNQNEKTNERNLKSTTNSPYNLHSSIPEKLLSAYKAPNRTVL